MRYISGTPAKLELTRRNLEVLLAKLDDPYSQRTLMKSDDENDQEAIFVTAVENDQHYSDRLPGEVYMPTSGETL